MELSELFRHPRAHLPAHPGSLSLSRSTCRALRVVGATGVCSSCLVVGGCFTGPQQISGSTNAIAVRSVLCFLQQCIGKKPNQLVMEFRKCSQIRLKGFVAAMTFCLFIYLFLFIEVYRKVSWKRYFSHLHATGCDILESCENVGLKRRRNIFYF